MKILSISVLTILIVIQSAYLQQPEAAVGASMIGEVQIDNESNPVVDAAQIAYDDMLESERRIHFEISMLAENYLLQGRQLLQEIHFMGIDSHDLLSRQSGTVRDNGMDLIDGGLMVLSTTENIHDDTGESAEAAIGAKAVMKTGSITIARVTAYAPFDNQSGMCNDGNPNVTSTGQRPGPSIVAVDPKKIPYGTKLKIEGFDRVFTAGDTGSILRRYEGVAIDVFFDTYKAARRFGVQFLEIELLD